MVRVLFSSDVDGASGDVFYHEFAGRSADDKPTANVATGSIFLEVDTGDVYVYDEDYEEWYEIGGSITSSDEPGLPL